MKWAMMFLMLWLAPWMAQADVYADLSVGADIHGNSFYNNPGGMVRLGYVDDRYKLGIEYEHKSSIPDGWPLYHFPFERTVYDGINAYLRLGGVSRGFYLDAGLANDMYLLGAAIHDNPAALVRVGARLGKTGFGVEYEQKQTNTVIYGGFNLYYRFD